MARKASIASLIPASQDIYRKIVFEIADGIIGMDEQGIIRLCNPAAEKLFGWNTGELLDKPLEVLLPERILSFHQKLVSGFRSGSADARHMGQRSASIVGRRSDGTEIDLGITILRTLASGEPMMVAVIRDISDHIRYQNELKRLAETDSLTGLFNRRAFRSNVFQSLSRGGPNGSSLVLFDLDDFKGVNDRFGHDAGDEAISRFADILRGSIPVSDVAGRWGGEEFILFIAETAPVAAAAVVETIRKKFAAIDFHWEGHAPVKLTVSAGLATAAPDASSLDEMIAHADKALYEAKRGGRNRLVCADVPEQALAF